MKGCVYMLCPKCGKTMKNVKHFEEGRSYQFNRCKCLFTTHKKRIHFDDDKETNQNYKEVNKQA